MQDFGFSMQLLVVFAFNLTLFWLKCKQLVVTDSVRYGCTFLFKYYFVKTKNLIATCYTPVVKF